MLRCGGRKKNLIIIIILRGKVGAARWVHVGSATWRLQQPFSVPPTLPALRPHPDPCCHCRVAMFPCSLFFSRITLNKVEPGSSAGLVRPAGTMLPRSQALSSTEIKSVIDFVFNMCIGFNSTVYLTCETDRAASQETELRPRGGRTDG